MIMDIVEDNNYKDMIEGQIYELIEYLISKDQFFSITANIKGIQFDPELPEAIMNSFPPFTLFSLENYTYSSIILTETTLSFEAGFGQENFGSVVTLPLYAIFQVVIEESILFLNPTATVEKYFEKSNDDEIDQETKSKNAFILNKKNKKLLS